MTIPYTKFELGNKLFTVEWELDPTQSGVQTGAPFEVEDCELLSIHALSNDGVQCELLVSNYSQAPTAGVALALAIPGQILIPYANTPNPMPPPMRWYWPIVVEFPSATISSKICLLFREVE